MAVPAAEVAIDEDLVRALLRAQRPDLAELPLRRAGSGWDNEIWRLGADLAVRLPRRDIAVALLASEQRWVGELGAGLPVDVPTPVCCGVAAEGYPWPWSIVPWLDGATPEGGPFGVVAARQLGATLHALHRPAPAEAPHNPYRSIPLSARPSPLGQLGLLAPGALRRVWERALAAPAPARRFWIHGDLHVRNLLVRDGDLGAVIDWGDVCGGDPAVDLSVLWTVLDPVEHVAFCDTYGPVDGDLHARARGWALVFGAIFAGLDDDPGAVAIGRRTLDRLAG